MQLGELLHELLRHRQLVGGVGDLREAARTLDPRHQERGLGGMGGDQRGDAHRRRAERAVHRGLARQRVERGRLRAEPGIRAQPELDDGAVGEVGVDRVTGARGAADATVHGEPRCARHLGDPRLERRVEVGQETAVDLAEAPGDPSEHVGVPHGGGTAVDEVERAGHEAGFVGREERDEVGDLVGRGVTADRRVLHVLVDDLRHQPHAVGEPGAHEPGTRWR